ncbi:MAG: hypothetical protein OXE84_07305 [Rhodobacteraceae bacterium]|nr:hypothetical protein [Paracoccaceae bacterium]MCY4196785.1 hypothetical protein [Paracoccaceae bacterium]
MEGREGPLAKRGTSHDGKTGPLPFACARLCNRDGCPVSVQAFPGDTADPKIVGDQMATLRQWFGLNRIVLVGDCGRLTAARMCAAMDPIGLDWITALKGTVLRRLIEDDTVEMSLFADRDRVDITRDADPSERLMVCRNPLRAGARACKRRERISTTARGQDR